MKQIQPQNGCSMFVILEHVVTFESLINLLGFASTSILGYENNKRKRMAERKRKKKEQRSTFSKLRRELVANKYRRRCSAQTLHYDPKNLKTVYETQKRRSGTTTTTTTTVTNNGKCNPHKDLDHNLCNNAIVGCLTRLWLRLRRLRNEVLASS